MLLPTALIILHRRLGPSGSLGDIPWAPETSPPPAGWSLWTPSRQGNSKRPERIPSFPPPCPPSPRTVPAVVCPPPAAQGGEGCGCLSSLFPTLTLSPHPSLNRPYTPSHPRDTPRLPPQSSISAPAPSHRAFCFLSPSSAHSPRRVRTDATMEILKILQDLVIFRKLPRPLKQLPKPALLWLSRHLPRHPTRAPTTQVLRSALVPARAVPSSSPTSDPPPGLPEPKEPSWPVPHCLQGPAAWGIFSGLGNTAAPPDPGQGVLPWSCALGSPITAQPNPEGLRS